MKGYDQMALNIRKVTKDQLPKTNVPGRTRQPSDFDPYMEEAYQDGEWRGVPYGGTEEGLNTLLNELGRAASHAGYGKSTRTGVDEDTNEPTLYFLIRDKLPTGRRSKGEDDGDEGNPEGVEVGEDAGNSGPDTSDDQGLEGIATSIEDAKSAKRERGKGKVTRDPVTTEAGGW